MFSTVGNRDFIYKVNFKATVFTDYLINFPNDRFSEIILIIFVLYNEKSIMLPVLLYELELAYPIHTVEDMGKILTVYHTATLGCNRISRSP